MVEDYDITAESCGVGPMRSYRVTVEHRESGATGSGLGWTYLEAKNKALGMADLDRMSRVLLDAADRTG
jgi:hypothetical protein